MLSSFGKSWQNRILEHVGTFGIDWGFFVFYILEKVTHLERFKDISGHLGKLGKCVFLEMFGSLEI